MTQPRITILVGDALAVLRAMPAEAVDCCVTSPPYWGLRDYGVAGAMGSEPTLTQHIEAMVDLFREIRRVLKPAGTVWLNYGDVYASEPNGRSAANSKAAGADDRTHRDKPFSTVATAKPKNLLMIPNRLAIALQDDGWFVRSEIIWGKCLTGNAHVYARLPKGETVMMVKDLARHRREPIELWTGDGWSAMTSITRNGARADLLELELRSGEQIACTPDHRFPTSRGLLFAHEIETGDLIDQCVLPEPAASKDCALDEDAAWFAGLYLAEGSRSGNTLQFAGHKKEEARWERVQRVAAKYGGSCTQTINGNHRDIRVYGRVLFAVVDEFVSGKRALDKFVSPVAWRYSNKFLAAFLQGYLSGDGHWDAKNRRWQLGFARNRFLERDLRTLCARLGHTLTLRASSVPYKGTRRATYKGAIRMTRSGHHNERPMNEVVAIRRARRAVTWDIAVADEPHLFALSSGTLTHNSNPKPDSVKDRPGVAHEKIFMLTKAPRYFYNATAGRQLAVGVTDHDLTGGGHKRPGQTDEAGSRANAARVPPGRGLRNYEPAPLEVWRMATAPYRGDHYATFPPELARRCIEAGCPPGGTVLDPFGGSCTTGIVAQALDRPSIMIELSPAAVEDARRRIRDTGGQCIVAHAR